MPSRTSKKGGHLPIPRARATKKESSALERVLDNPRVQESIRESREVLALSEEFRRLGRQRSLDIERGVPGANMPLVDDQDRWIRNPVYPLYNDFFDRDEAFKRTHPNRHPSC